LRIRLSAKRAPPRFECNTQFPVIVDLPIKRNDELAVGARHRLRTAFGKVDDRQSAMPQAHTFIPRIPLAKPIRTSRDHMIANAPQLGEINRMGRVMMGVDPRDATHGGNSRPVQMPRVCNTGLVSEPRNSRPASAKRMPSKH